KVMSALFRPTCGLAAAMFSTLAAITSFWLTSPPVSGSAGFSGCLVAVVGAGDGDSVEMELVVSGSDFLPLMTAAMPMPPATTTAMAAAVANAKRERLMNEWA